MSHRRASRERSTRSVSTIRNGTIHKFFAVKGTDKINNNGIQIQIRTKIFNLCAMTVYENKSMEELRFEDYINNRNFPSSSSLFREHSVNDSRTDHSSSVENKSIVSTSSLSSVTFNAPVTTPFMFGSSLIDSFKRIHPFSTSVASSSPSLFGNKQTTTTTTSFDFASAVRDLKKYTNDSDIETSSTTQRRSRIDSKVSQSSSPEIVQVCVDCNKIPHMQCLHCSKPVCMDCAPKHVALVNEEIAAAQHTLNDKMSILDRLSAAAKERVNAERDKIIQQADTERDQALAQIDQLLEQQKKQLQDKGTQLNQLTLDKISSYAQSLTKEIEVVNEDNDQLFYVTSTPAKIVVQNKQQIDIDKELFFQKLTFI